MKQRRPIDREGATTHMLVGLFLGASMGALGAAVTPYLTGKPYNPAEGFVIGALSLGLCIFLAILTDRYYERVKTLPVRDDAAGGYILCGECGQAVADYANPPGAGTTLEPICQRCLLISLGYPQPAPPWGVKEPGGAS